MRLRAGLVGTVLFVTAITMGAALATVSAVFNRAQRRELDSALQDVARAEGTEARANGYRFSARPGPAANDVGPLTKFGIIYDNIGHVIAATEPFDRSPPPLASIRHRLDKPFDLRFMGKHLRCVLIAVPSAPDKLLLLAASREDLDSDETFLNRAMLVAFILAVAWAGLLAKWMVRRQLRYHESLARVARRVAGGDLDARVQILSPDPEVAQLGRDVDAMIVQLSALMSAQQRFIAHAAHELRSPLAALYGELQQALRKARDVESYKATIQQALLSTRRLNQLADDLLTLARPSNVLQSEAREPIATIVSHAVDLVRARAEERNVRVQTEIAAEHVCGRARDLERMLRNLVENAVEHSPAGDVVHVCVSRTGDVLQFAVEDRGPGIPVDEQDRIFEPFYRARLANGAAQRGAGLGLAIAREIARGRGGDIHVEAIQPEAGTRFVARIACIEA
jgi:two-component system heavy metal sensor histidine kinase CusS